jgi:hypothetical protein
VELKSYPKIFPLVGRYADLVTNGDTIEITEKVDGSMFAFGRDTEGKLHFRSKGQPIDERAPPTMFAPAVDHIMHVADRIPAGFALYGETLQKPRHNTLAYNAVPRGHVALFGVFDFERTSGLNHVDMSAFASKLDIDVVPLVYEGPLDSISKVPELLDRESFLGGQKIEGVVLKNYSKAMEFSGMILPITVLKFVSEQFKEKHSNNPDWKPSKDALEEVLEQYRKGREARWIKAIQRHKEAGLYVGEPKDIGPLMKSIWEDTLAEEKVNFMEELFHIYKKRLAGAAQAGFPEWYKTQYLLNDLPATSTLAA